MKIGEDVKVSEGAEVTVWSFIKYGYRGAYRRYEGNIYKWFELEEGGQIDISVPSKNLKYVVKSFAGDISALPPQLLLPNSTHLGQNNEVVVSLLRDDEGESRGALTTNVGNIENIKYDAAPLVIPLGAPSIISLNNCDGSTILTQDKSDEWTIVHEYKVDVGGEVGVEVPIPVPILLPKLVAVLQGNYSFAQGQVETQIVSYHLGAEPGANQQYTISLQEVWETGTAQTLVDNTLVSIPFQVKKELKYATKAESLGCD